VGDKSADNQTSKGTQSGASKSYSFLNYWNNVAGSVDSIKTLGVDNNGAFFSYNNQRYTFPLIQPITGQYLGYNGDTRLEWLTPSSGGTPAGNYGNIQINRNGAFDTPGGDSLSFNESTATLNVIGGIQAADAVGAETPAPSYIKTTNDLLLGDVTNGVYAQISGSNADNTLRLYSTGGNPMELHDDVTVIGNITAHNIIGATATPIRSGKMRELKQDYDEIITGVQIPELIETGFLSPVETFGVKIDLTGVRTLAGDYAADDLEKIYAKKYVGAVENYLKHTPGKKALCFCATVKNSIDLSAEFERAGVSSKHIDATTPENERAQILTDFDAGKFKVLSNVGILTKGYDCPTIETIILYRATQSLPLFLQMCGRGSRVSPGKGKFTILDFGNNVLRHGFWEEKRYWSLENEVKKERGKKDIATVKICPQCEAMIYVSVKICGFCGYDFTDKQKEENEKQFAILSQMTPSQVNAYTHFATVEELEQLRIAKGYKAGWILHKLETLKQYEDYGKLKGYKRGWAYWQWKNRSENTK